MSCLVKVVLLWPVFHVLGIVFLIVGYTVTPSPPSTSDAKTLPPAQGELKEGTIEPQLWIQTESVVSWRDAKMKLVMEHSGRPSKGWESQTLTLQYHEYVRRKERRN